MDRGEIWHCDLSPSAGREQKGPHYVLIISPSGFNKGGVPIVCPITTVGNSSRMKGFAVSLSGAGTSVTGVVQVDQLTALDMVARKGRSTREKVPPYIVEDVLEKIAAIAQ
jgi:mRNA-degrading endonuclease toxin of MazEF toxin-antitoxin module